MKMFAHSIWFMIVIHLHLLLSLTCCDEGDFCPDLSLCGGNRHKICPLLRSESLKTVTPYWCLDYSEEISEVAGPLIRRLDHIFICTHKHLFKVKFKENQRKYARKKKSIFVLTSLLIDSSQILDLALSLLENCFR